MLTYIKSEKIISKYIVVYFYFCPMLTSKTTVAIFSKLSARDYTEGKCGFSLGIRKSKIHLHNFDTA
jgi:hypothetical protein